MDSAAEARVFRHLLDLQAEGVLAGLITHPKVAGMNGDFLVQFGPKGPPGMLHEILLIEYDGMGIYRPRSVEPKLRRHAELEILGLRCRWLHLDTYAGLRDLLFHYNPPPLVTKRLVCPCGRESDTLVVFARPSDLVRLAGSDEFEQSASCAACPPSP